MRYIKKYEEYENTLEVGDYVKYKEYDWQKYNDILYKIISRDGHGISQPITQYQIERVFDPKGVWMKPWVKRSQLKHITKEEIIENKYNL